MSLTPGRPTARPTAPARMARLAKLPVFWSLEAKHVVVAGGSDGAAWKAELLAACGAYVHVYCAEEDVGEVMRGLIGAGSVLPGGGGACSEPPSALPVEEGMQAPEPPLSCRTSPPQGGRSTRGALMALFLRMRKSIYQHSMVTSMVDVVHRRRCLSRSPPMWGRCRQDRGGEPECKDVTARVHLDTHTDHRHQ